MLQQLNRFAWLPVSLSLVMAAGCETTACVPGEVAPCACSDGRGGTQICLAGETFAPCVCEGGIPDGGPEDSGTTDSSTDSGTSDDGGDGGTTAGDDPELVRTAPLEDVVYVRDTLMVQVSLRRGEADRVELFIDGTFLVELPPPYSYVWDTRTTAEGAHEVVAHGYRGVTRVSTTPLTVIVDRTAPRLESHHPVADETNAWLGRPITLDLSEEVVVASVSASSVQLSTSTSAGVAADVTLDPMRSHIEVVLGATLELPETLTVTLTDAITDLAGNPFVPEAFSFTAPVWNQVEGDIEDPVTLRPSVIAFSTNATGTEHVVAWTTAIGLYTELYVSRYVEGEGYGPLGGGLTADYMAWAQITSVAVQQDSTGDPWVAWVQNVTPEPVLHLAHWNGASWDEVVDPMVADPRSIFMKLDSTDQPILLVLDGTTRGVLRFLRWSGTTWETVADSLVGLEAQREPVPFELTTADRPVVGINGTNPVITQWTGTEWLAYDAPPAACGGFLRDLALDADGDPAVICQFSLSGSIYPYYWDSSWRSLSSASSDSTPTISVTTDNDVVVQTMYGRDLVTYRYDSPTYDRIAYETIPDIIDYWFASYGGGVPVNLVQMLGSWDLAVHRHNGI